MKKIMMILVSGVIYTSLITGYANAQKVVALSFAALKKMDYKTYPAGDEKSDSTSFVDTAKTVSIKDLKANLKEAKANLKVKSHFIRNFKNVSNISWNFQDDLTMAKFKMDGKSVKVVYDRNGNWAYTIVNFHEDQMPLDVKSLIKYNYIGYDISLIQEISQREITCYMVYLENETSFRHVLVYDGEIITDEKFNKGIYEQLK